MPDTTTFAAQVLETGASAYAGYAASLLLERRPAILDRYGPSAMRDWKAHLTERVRELAAALAAEEPRLFAARLRWEDQAFRARDLGNEDLLAGLECLREVLGEALPERTRGVVADYLEPAVESLSAPAPARRRDPDPSDPKGKLALQYLKTVLEGESRRALDLVTEAHREGMTIRELYLDVLLVAQRQVGEMWHLGDLGIAEEHFVTATTQRAMAILAQRVTPEKSLGKTIVTAAVSGNTHALGVRVLADFFEFAGWRSVCLGPDVPPADIAAAAMYFEADVLALSATLSTHLRTVGETIAAVRDLPGRKVAILVGGGAFDDATHLWERLGADGYAPTVEVAVETAGRLVGLDAGGP